MGQDTAWKWRKALGVGAITEGTSKLKGENALGPGVVAGREKAAEQSRYAVLDAARREKIAQAKRGKPRPPHVIEAMREGRTGKPHSEETRNKMSKCTGCEIRKTGQAGRCLPQS